MKGGQGVISSLFLSFPAACVEWCSWLHLLVTGVHGVGSDGQPGRAGGFPEGVFVAQREPAAAALPRGGCHQRPGWLAPLQVLGTSAPAAPVFGVLSASGFTGSCPLPFQLLAVLNLGRGAASCPTGSEAFDHCGESGGAGQGGVLAAVSGCPWCR